MITKKYIIATLKFNICYENDEYFENCLSTYENDFQGDADIYINIAKTSDCINPSYNNLVSVADSKYWYVNSEGNDCIFWHDSEIGCVTAHVCFSDDYSHVDVLLYNLDEIYNVSQKCFMFNVTGNAMHYIMQMHNGFVFHSSALVCESNGVAFSAKSGTGKSTHTELWINQIPNTLMLNDDTPVIKVMDDGSVIICGTPWAGTTGINTNMAVPLKALVFLARGADNEIERVLPATKFQEFFDGVMSPLGTSMKMNLIDTMDKVFKQVPVYSLACNMEPDAAFVAYSGIFKQ